MSRAPRPPSLDDRADLALFGPSADPNLDGASADPSSGLSTGWPDDFPDEFEALAAALTTVPADFSAPADLMASLRADAEAFKVDAAQAPAPPALAAAAESDAPAGAKATAAKAAGTVSLWTLAGWALALSLGALLLWPSADVNPVPTEDSPSGTAVSEAAFEDLTPNAARERLLTSDSLIRVAMEGKEDDASRGVGPAGETLWDAVEQVGVMALTGLKPNDPAEFQYQLWIFDAERDERYPVDGGVFDIPAGAGPDDAALIPFVARLPVNEATLFAVTVEPPGGVVVSDRSRLPAAGTVSL